MNDKKISMYTIIALASGLVTIAIIALIIFLIAKPKSITDIIDKKTLNRISYVTCNNGNETSVSAMLADFKESSFKPYKDEIQNTANLSFTFLDENNNILFTYIETGYNNVIEFRINGKSKYYVKNGVLR